MEHKPIDPVASAIDDPELPAGVSIDAAEDIFLLLAAQARGLKEAHLWRVDLDQANRVLGCELIVSRGADTHVIHPRSVFRVAIGRAAKIVLVHNHPSQELALTDGDYILTEMMALFGDLLRIQVHDHVIMTDTAYFSFKAAGLL